MISKKFWFHEIKKTRGPITTYSVRALLYSKPNKSAIFVRAFFNEISNILIRSTLNEIIFLKTSNFLLILLQMFINFKLNSKVRWIVFHSWHWVLKFLNKSIKKLLKLIFQRNLKILKNGISLITVRETKCILNINVCNFLHFCKDLFLFLFEIYFFSLFLF